tara:strand:+ start:755 stop:1363 length:609 start_codon:yes stop_codon:yes gene_type:complete
MEITNAKFLMSNTDVSKCPDPKIPEYAFIGRSNVGKSSLINMLVNHKGLAKTSGKPGKTQLINHFIIDDSWYIVDLPGYGYAKVSKKSRLQFHQLITNYLKKRENLMCVCVLLDSRLPPQQIDLDFMEWLGINRLPFVMVFTKTDKLSSSELMKNMKQYTSKMLELWEELPPIYKTSAQTGAGKQELLQFIDHTNSIFTQQA